MHDPVDILKWSELSQIARDVRARAYAPYSNYAVGVAILGSNGKIYSGCNVENASYGMTICAERNAVFQAVADGCTELVAMVIATETGEGMSCGGCRQVLYEFARGDFPISTVDCMGNPVNFESIKSILPLPFGRWNLQKEEGQDGN